VRDWEPDVEGNEMAGVAEGTWNLWPFAASVFDRERLLGRMITPGASTDQVLASYCCCLFRNRARISFACWESKRKVRWFTRSSSFRSQLAVMRPVRE